MEEIEWIKFPHDLQVKFFINAEKETKRVIDSIIKLQEKMHTIKNDIVKNLEPLEENDKVFKVASIDGSRSPRLSERLGIRYGVFTASIIVLEGKKNIHEDFEAGQFKRKQAFSQEVSKYFFDMLSTYAERKIALENLDKADFLILDGSFYGFIYTARRINREGLLGESEKEILNKLIEMTNKLIDSKKVFSVIKRSHTRVIEGLLYLKNRNYVPDKIIDKLILSYIMPARTIFRYEKLIGEEDVGVYTRVAYYAERKKEENLLEYAKRMGEEPFKELEIKDHRKNLLKRMQVKAFNDTTVCEIEYPSIPIEKMKEWIGQKNFFNEATGLPIALDIVDSLTRFTPKFTEEYVAEIESRLLEYAEKGDISKEAIKWFFSLLNPQKPY
jgi:hypothetical protein